MNIVFQNLITEVKNSTEDPEEKFEKPWGKNTGYKPLLQESTSLQA